jgi:hypothetical protein
MGVPVVFDGTAETDPPIVEGLGSGIATGAARVCSGVTIADTGADGVMLCTGISMRGRPRMLNHASRRRNVVAGVEPTAAKNRPRAQAPSPIDSTEPDSMRYLQCDAVGAERGTSA